MFLGLARFLRTCKSFCIKIFDINDFGRLVNLLALKSLIQMILEDL